MISLVQAFPGKSCGINLNLKKKFELNPMYGLRQPHRIGDCSEQRECHTAQS